MKRTRAHLTVLVLALLGLAAAARAQEGEDFSNPAPTRTAAPARSIMPGRGSGEVTLTVRSFGLGDRARPGEWVPILVEVSDSSDKVRNVMVRVGAPDLDGDEPLMQRVIVTNPGSAQHVWLYTRLPFAAVDRFEFTASEAVEAGAPGAGESQRYEPGRLLGALPYQPSQARSVWPTTGLIGVVGGHTAGLDQYSWVADQTGRYSVTGNELTQVIGGLGLASLPDRWQGYSGLQALVWTSQATEDSPLNIREAQATAIREWVQQHGGHFVVVLPPVAQGWVAQPTNPLADIMPRVKVNRAEGVDLNDYRSLITRDPKVALPDGATVQSFTPDGGGPHDAMAIMTGPKGEVVVVRRIVGNGMVTVVGLDVASVKLHMHTDVFQADQFWNRVLGKRLALYPPGLLSPNMRGKRLPNGQMPPQYEWQVQDAYIDGGIAGEVNNPGSAAVGLLLAFVVFAAYWLVAGPLGYFVLKQRNWKRHAWVGFVVATGVFTAVAWGGANVLKPRRVNGKHLTIVDGVYGQTGQRARSWMGLFLPRYGEQEVSVADAGGEVKNLIATWDPPPTNGTGGSSWWTFPDARGYVMDARKPDAAAFPARATTKQVQVDWAGSLPANWGMPHPLADGSVPVGQEIRIRKREGAKPGERAWILDGVLTHSLPGPLTNVFVTVVVKPVDQSIDEPANVRMIAKIAHPSDEWQPGQSLVLDAMFDHADDAWKKLREGALVPRASTQHIISQDYPRDNMALAATFFDVLQPAEKSGNDSVGSRTLMQRSALHGMDLSRWFTQPCVIVVGELGAEKGDVECPIPVRVDSLSGDEVRKRLKGRTIVRWVYPLEAAPVTAYVLPGAGAPPGPSGGGNGGGGSDEGGNP